MIWHWPILVGLWIYGSATFAMGYTFGRSSHED